MAWVFNPFTGTFDQTGTGGGGGSTSPGGTNGQLQFNNAGAFGGLTIGGDATLNASTGALTVTKSSGASFAALAFKSSAAIGSDVSGLGTGIATALAIAVGSAGAPVLLNGAGGTPTSLTLTNATGLPVGGISATGTPSATTYLRGDGSWQAVSGGGTPGGSANQLQYNTGSAFGGMSGTSWDDTNRSLTLTGATVTTSKPVLDLSQTWNDGAVTFTGLKFNAAGTSGTNSAAGSLLLDLQTGGVSYARVTKDGRFSFGTGTFTSVYQFNLMNNYTCYGSSGSAIHSFSTTTAGGTTALCIATKSSAIEMINAYALGWSAAPGSTAGAGTLSGDLYLYRDAADTLALRRTTNPQRLNSYRTFTDAANYQRLSLAWNTSTALVMNEGAGTGADGSVAFNDAALATDATRGFIMVPSCAGAPTGTPADIPTGQIPLVWDSTNLKLYVYTGGAWKSSAAFT